MDRLLKLAALCSLALTLEVFAPTPALGQNKFLVNSTGYGSDIKRNGVCETAPGNRVCTLRAALQEANFGLGTDGISFKIPTTDPGYNPQTGAWTIRLDQLLFPEITDGVNISGPGASKLILDGISYERIFNITTNANVTISSLTIANGRVPGGGRGAGIRFTGAGRLAINNCQFIGNHADYPDTGGGAIFNGGPGTVAITTSTFKLNSAHYEYQGTLSAQGGAILNDFGAVEIVDSVFENNMATLRGGAIANLRGIVTVSGSTFRDNGTGLYGGAIGNLGGTLNVSNSTFYANVAFRVSGEIPAGVGGAIANAPLGTLNLSNSTVTANLAGRSGGGVFNDAGGTSNATVKSTIVAENQGGTFNSYYYVGVPPARAGRDVFGTFVSNGFNLIGVVDGGTGFTLATDLKGTVSAPFIPKFDGRGLRNNGGPTDTIAVASDSPAVDAGTALGISTILTTDQRRGTFLRTVEQPAPNAPGGDGTDIGAYELQ